MKIKDTCKEKPVLIPYSTLGGGAVYRTPAGDIRIKILFDGSDDRRGFVYCIDPVTGKGFTSTATAEFHVAEVFSEASLVLKP